MTAMGAVSRQTQVSQLRDYGARTVYRKRSDDSGGDERRAMLVQSSCTSRSSRVRVRVRVRVLYTYTPSLVCSGG